MARARQIVLIVSAIVMLAAGLLQLYSGHKREMRLAAQKEKIESLRKQILQLEMDLQKHKGVR
jgi:hypothetical protein